MDRDFYLKLRRFYFSPAMIWIILALGIFLRLRQYASNMSLWRDEAALAINFVTRSFSEMLLPLRNGEVVPFGFLLAERWAVELLGPSEYALRFFPLIAGILALFVFHRVLKKAVHPGVVPLALLLFAVSGPLVYFSSEVKQYSFDALAACLVLLMTARIAQAPSLSWREALVYGIWGAGLLWFSHPAVFLLSAAALMLIVGARKKQRGVTELIVMFSVWWLSFVFSYTFSRRYLLPQVNDHLMQYWQDAFMPLSLGGVSWILRSFSSLFDFGGYAPSGLVMFAWIAGVIMLISKKETLAAGMCVVPVILAMLASAFHLYPFSDRLALFIFPLLIMLVAEGVVLIKTLFDHNNHRFLGGSWIVLILAVPFLSAGFYALKPRARGESIRPLIGYVKTRMKPGDALYIYSGSIPGFEYYSAVDRFSPLNAVKGVLARGNPQEYIEDLKPLSGRSRVWFIFSHVVHPSGIDERKFILNHLDFVGKKIDQYEVTAKPMLGPRREPVTEAVYLYDLSGDSFASQDLGAQHSAQVSSLE